MNESASDQPSEGASAALERYRAQLQSIDQDQEALQIKDRQFSKVRAILFLVSLAFLVVGYGFDGLPYVGWFGWGAMALFLVAVTANEPVREKLEELGRHRSVVRRLVARLERDWDRLSTKASAKSLAEVELPGHRRDVASDLDLLGNASLFHLVSMAATTPGIRTLANWLAGPAEENDAKQRWIAVNALAPLRDERLRFYTLARQVADSSGDPENFIQWATGPAWLAKRNWLVLWSNASAALAGIFLLLTVVSGFGLLTAQVFIGSLIAMGCLIAINMGLTTLMLGPAHAIFAIAMANRRAVSDYEEIFSSAEWLPNSEQDSKQKFLTQIRDRMLKNDRSAQVGMRALQKVAAAGGLRQSAGTFLIYLPLQGLTLWDVRVLKRLENWQAEYASDVPGWFEALGELESLISVAAVRDEYPSWSQPEWVSASDSPVIAATGIGHPLLADGSRVCNDVQVGPPGTILLVTGSNMSGKSTMLRSVGLNVALAAVGAPVCAKTFCLPSTELATSIRVSDNVAEGVSFYMAELKRLKSVVDHAREMSRSNDRVCLFLLDEILQGTNSRERQIAVVQVLRHLMDYQSIGAISTHDLELADEPELQSVGHAVHFRETIRPDASGNEQMTFDYRMREGVSPTTNALRLLEMVGLGEKADQTNKSG
ncbi:MutS family DNA mismatch repair protein [Rhodopirellula sp.]|nr:MutS family DNA mismatch repair protein [Rhodopirellula sp.]